MGQHIAEQKHLNRQIDNLEKRAAHWQENAELAVSKGKDDLARAALKEKKELEAKQAELQEKLNEAKAKQKALAVRRQSASVRMQAKQATHSDKLDSVMGRFDHYEQRVDELEARVEAYDLTDSASKSSLQAEFDALEKDESIEQELAALKAKKVA